MNATGLFFLSGRPSLVNARNPETGETRKQWHLPLLERLEGRAVQQIVGVWPGLEAAAFVKENSAVLKAGAPLQITFTRIRPDGDHLIGRISTCTLAPTRWPTEATTQPTETAPAA